MNQNFNDSKMVNEEYFKTIFDTLSEGVALNELVFDSNGVAIDYRVIAVNKSFYNTADYDKSIPVIGALATKLYGLEIKPITEFWLSHKNSQQTEKTEFYSALSQRYFIISTSPFMNNKFVTSFFDITDRKHSENILREQQELLNFALEGSGYGIWDWHIPDKKVKLSKRLLELYGVPDSPSEISFSEATFLVHPDDLVNVVSQLESHIRNDYPYESEYRVIMPNGEIKWFLARGKVVSRSTTGEPLRMIGTVVDISRIKIAESQMLLNSKMSSLGEMSAGIAHEINNPLTIISASLDLLKRDASKTENIPVRIEIIKKATARIEKIVNGLKKFSRSSIGNEFKICSLRSIIQESIVLLDSVLKRIGATLEIEIDSEFNIYCDEIEIEQVIINLVNNSVDAIKNLDKRWVKITVKELNQKIVFCVIDSGSGIPYNIQQKLFDPFFTTKPVGEGTGLGLSIIKGILDQHKATIRVDNNSANTCFEIVFSKPEVYLNAN